MSFGAKRELLLQISARYRDASHQQKSIILDEFIAATGYARKYAIRLLTRPAPSPVAAITRPRAPRYGLAVQEALRVAWAAANGICGKRLVPFLPELVASLERHGHLHLTAEVRAQLLTLSPATGDRLLRSAREAPVPRSLATTKPGAIRKRQIPIRTFAGWDEAQPGFVEADLVAHCGQRAEGTFLYTLVLTDVGTGWTECLPLLHRGQHAVLQALDRARQLLPFPLLGLDTDNGGEFLNEELLAYCRREQITFTRGRAYRKNDQCFVEQKNGAIVRQLVGYDRFEGEAAYRQLTEVYRAVRFYINFFQPSMKLREKQRDGSRTRRRYDSAQTPYRRLLATGLLAPDTQQRLVALAQSLDPVRLLHQIETLLDALWRHAVFLVPGGAVTAEPRAETAPVAFQRTALTEPHGGGPDPEQADVRSAYLTRRYRRTQRRQGPRWWRTRPDPFAAVWDEVAARLAAAPERTAKSIFVELQQRYPGQFPDVQLRTLQRRVQVWRADALLTFDDQWRQEDTLLPPVLPSPLRALSLSRSTGLPDELLLAAERRE
jgi:hypothetical protein